MNSGGKKFRDLNSKSSNNALKSNSDKPGKTNLSICSLNVCGIKRRFQYPEFQELVNKFDIFCVLETKLDNLNSFSLSNYTFIHQSRRQKCLRRSGGIGVFIRNELVQRVKLIESSSDYVLWLRVSETHHNKNNEAMLGVVYQPPESSRFLTEDEQELLEVEITSMCISNEVVYLVGDMNARVSNENDFIDADTFFSDYFDFDEEILRHFNKSDIFFS